MANTRHLTEFMKGKSVWIHGCSAPLGFHLVEIAILLGARVYGSDNEIAHLSSLKARYPNQLITFAFDKSDTKQQKNYLTHLKGSKTQLSMFFDFSDPCPPETDDSLQNFCLNLQSQCINHIDFFQSLEDCCSDEFVYVHLSRKSNNANQKVFSYIKNTMLKTLRTKESFFDLRLQKPADDYTEDETIFLIKSLLHALRSHKRHLYFGMHRLSLWAFQLRLRLWSLNESLQFLKPPSIDAELSAIVDSASKPQGQQNPPPDSSLLMSNASPPQEESLPLGNTIPVRASVNVFSTDSFPIPGTDKKSKIANGEP